MERKVERIHKVKDSIMTGQTSVFISGNYETQMLKKLSPNRDGWWKNVKFVFQPTEEYDFVLIMNYSKQGLKLHCSPQNIWAVMQEPYIRGRFEWMKKGHDQYSKVFTHDPPNTDPKYIKSPPFLAWYFNKTYSELCEMPVPVKTDLISCVSSNKNNFPGHKKRLQFVENLMKDENLNIDFFGRGFNHIEDKWDALAPYYFSVAIENTAKEDYWTEKISDCFLAYNVPIYYGCTNIEDYFPKNSYIHIDIEDPEEAKTIIEKNATRKEWERRLPDIIKARDLVLNDYNLLNVISNEIEKQTVNNPEKKVILLNKFKYSSIDLAIRFIDKLFE